MFDDKNVQRITAEWYEQRSCSACTYGLLQECQSCFKFNGYI